MCWPSAGGRNRSAAIRPNIDNRPARPKCLCASPGTPLDLAHQGPMLHLRQFQRLRHAQHAACRHARLVQLVFPVLRPTDGATPPRSAASTFRGCACAVLVSETADRRRDPVVRSTSPARRTDRRCWRRCSASPCPVLNVPDGAAVKLSLPIGSGLTARRSSSSRRPSPSSRSSSRASTRR